MENWQDLRLFLAVTRGGSGSAGARQLGIDQSTVSRRLNQFEKKLGARLFNRSTTGYALTAAGQKMYDTALRIELEITELDRTLAGQEQILSGTVRVTTADTLSNHLLLPIAQSFLERYPGINLTIQTSYDVVSLNNMEADVAIRITDEPQESLVGRKLATAAFSTYASAEYIKTHRDYPEKMLWMNWDDGSPEPNWPKLAASIPEHQCRLRMDTVPALLEAARQHIGATILPCFMGDAAHELERVPPGHIISQRDIWLLVHRDLRYTARIRAFLDHLSDSIKPLRPLIKGDQYRP